MIPTAQRKDRSFYFFFLFSFITKPLRDSIRNTIKYKTNLSASSGAVRLSHFFFFYSFFFDLLFVQNRTLFLNSGKKEGRNERGCDFYIVCRVDKDRYLHTGKMKELLQNSVLWVLLVCCFEWQRNSNIQSDVVVILCVSLILFHRHTSSGAYIVMLCITNVMYTGSKLRDIRSCSMRTAFLIYAKTANYTKSIFCRAHTATSAPFWTVRREMLIFSYTQKSVLLCIPHPIRVLQQVTGKLTISTL